MATVPTRGGVELDVTVGGRLAFTTKLRGAVTDEQQVAGRTAFTTRLRGAVSDELTVSGTQNAALALRGAVSLDVELLVRPVLTTNLRGAVSDDVEVRGTPGLTTNLRGSLLLEETVHASPGRLLLEPLRSSVTDDVTVAGTLGFTLALRGSVEDDVTLRAITSAVEGVTAAVEDDLRLSGRMLLLTAAEQRRGRVEDDLRLWATLSLTPPVVPPAPGEWTWDDTQQGHIANGGYYALLTVPPPAPRILPDGAGSVSYVVVAPDGTVLGTATLTRNPDGTTTTTYTGSGPVPSGSTLLVVVRAPETAPGVPATEAESPPPTTSVDVIIGGGGTTQDGTVIPGTGTGGTEYDSDTPPPGGGTPGPVLTSPLPTVPPSGTITIDPPGFQQDMVVPLYNVGSAPTGAITVNPAVTMDGSTYGVLQASYAVTWTATVTGFAFFDVTGQEGVSFEVEVRRADGTEVYSTTTVPTGIDHRAVWFAEAGTTYTIVVHATRYLEYFEEGSQYVLDPATGEPLEVEVTESYTYVDENGVEVTETYTYLDYVTNPDYRDGYRVVPIGPTTVTWGATDASVVYGDEWEGGSQTANDEARGWLFAMTKGRSSGYKSSGGEMRWHEFGDSLTAYGAVSELSYETGQWDWLDADRFMGGRVPRAFPPDGQVLMVADSNYGVVEAHGPKFPPQWQGSGSSWPAIEDFGGGSNTSCHAITSWYAFSSSNRAYAFPGGSIVEFHLGHEQRTYHGLFMSSIPPRSWFTETYRGNGNINIMLDQGRPILWEDGKGLLKADATLRLFGRVSNYTLQESGLVFFGPPNGPAENRFEIRLSDASTLPGVEVTYTYELSGSSWNARRGDALTLAYTEPAEPGDGGAVRVALEVTGMQIRDDNYWSIPLDLMPGGEHEAWLSDEVLTGGDDRSFFHEARQLRLLVSTDLWDNRQALSRVYGTTGTGQVHAGVDDFHAYVLWDNVRAPRYKRGSYVEGPRKQRVPPMRQRARQDGLAAGTGARRGGSEPEMRQMSVRRGPGVVW